MATDDGDPTHGIIMAVWSIMGLKDVAIWGELKVMNTISVGWVNIGKYCLLQNRT